MKTNRIVPVIAVTVTMLGAAACRQPDGTMPMPDAEQVDRIEDLSRDLQNLAARNETAAKELADDLEVIGRMPVPAERVQELVRALETSLQGKTLTEDAAKRLAESMFLVMSARQLSDRQIETLQTEVTAQVKALGADEATATNVASAAGRLQEDVRANRRRWYQWF
jgi:cation diffusion facilitator CzcD-associated flavoprotein CzcO